MKLKILLLMSIFLAMQGCKTLENAIQPNVVYPCLMGCGDERITPPKGYVYYNHKVMKLSEFNRITNQHLVLH